MNNKSFTLIELLVVIVIIGILAGVIMISTSSSIDKANIAKGKVFANSLRNSLITNLVSEWKFEGPTLADQTVTVSDLQDDWGNNNSNITIQGAPKIKGGNDCVSGKCLSFSGTSDYVTCGNGGADLNVSSGDSMTIEVWVKLNVLGRTHSIVSKWTPWIFFVSGDNKQAFYIRSNGVDASIASNTALSLNKWHHLTVTYTKLSFKTTFYLDGKLDGSPSFANGIDNLTAGRVQIGGYGNVNNFINGKIDDVRIYNTALSSSQIRQDYVAGLNLLLSKRAISKEEYSQRINDTF